MVGMARKNENSAADRFSHFIRSAPAIVAPERDTPGTIARHWKMPMTNASPSGKRMASACTGFAS